MRAPRRKPGDPTEPDAPAVPSISEALSARSLPEQAPVPSSPLSSTTPTPPVPETPMTTDPSSVQHFDELPIATFAVDADGRVTAWNGAIAAMTRREAADVVGQKVWRGFLAKRGATPVDTALASGDPLDAPFEFHDSEGELVRVDLRILPRMGTNDEVEGATVCVLPSIVPDSSALRMRAAIEGATIAVMMADRNLVITYVNPATYELVKKNAAHFAAAFPGFIADRMVGTCIDVFHKDPAHQRRKLADPANLPVSLDIHVGPLVFLINVSAMKDEAGAYVGACLEWKDVTSVRKAENDAASMLSLAEGSMTNIMICDNDRKITYLNSAVKTMLAKYQTVLQKRFPTFDVDKLLGQSIDIFHANPAHQARLFRDLGNKQHRAEISVGGLEFGLNLTTLYDARCQMIGSSVEWIDQNARAEYRREVARVLDAANTGKLEVRGDLGKMDDVYRPMLSSINEIVDALLSPIAEIQDKLGRVAGGDLTAYVTVDYQGDHARLKNALNGTLDALNEIMGQVRVAADQIASGSGEVASSSQALSGGATKQAAAVEQITASISEMTDQTRKNAENAAQASQLATAAGELAQTGDERMKGMVRAMTDIDESSQNISKIIKVIDEIAFQTNLLALNAAVEAARAGVHGKGFAVVAEEVRNLAARSANAAKETTVMIEGSIKKVAQGSSIAEDTAQALSRIVGSVGKVKDLVAEIAAASNEQAQGITQIDQGLKQVDQVTQQNTASAEQSASAAEELSAQAGRLRELIGRFNLKAADAEVGGIEVTPELLAALEAYLKAQRGGASAGTRAASPPPPPTASAAAAARSRKVTPEQARSAPTNGQTNGHANGRSNGHGGDFIALTDTEFGRY